MVESMAELRPFRALRYDTSRAGDAASLVAPPYDVVSEADRQLLYARSIYNVAHVDYGEGRPGDSEHDNRYTRAAATLKRWREEGILLEEDEPRLYVYDQEFRLHGRTLRRRAVFGRLRLEEWEKGVVLPHETTGAAAKEDRLNLLRATRVHLSPILALYRDGRLPAINDADLGELLLDAELTEERHLLRVLQPRAAEAFCLALLREKLYIADGHHRYETALAYLDQRRAAASRWSGEEPENFILAALVSAADPGLVVLPTHRLLRLPEREVRISLRRLWAFRLEDAGIASDANLERLLLRLAEAGKAGTAFGAIGLEAGRLHLLTPRDQQALQRRLTGFASPALRGLDVTVLQRAIYPAIEFEESPGSIDYTESAHHALEAVASGSWDLAFLLNPTPVERVFAVADAGERMPRKSTYFFPKLATGVVMLPLD